MPTKSETCMKCGKCCQFFVLQAPRPPTIYKKTIDDLKEWYLARGLQIVKEIDKWFYIKIPLPCPHLNTSYEKWDKVTYSCDIYGLHPEICKNFDGRLMDKFHGLECKWATEKIEEKEGMIHARSSEKSV